MLGGRIHPDTRSRSNMAIFQLTAWTSDVSAIRPRAVLEIVETIPARTTSEPPSIRTLTYPVSIEIMHTEVVNYVLGAAAAPTGDNERTGNGNDAGDADRTGRRGPRWRCRKRRRPDSNAEPPTGRADGMALDIPTWAVDGVRRRADGVAIDGR